MGRRAPVIRHPSVKARTSQILMLESQLLATMMLSPRPNLVPQARSRVFMVNGFNLKLRIRCKKKQPKHVACHDFIQFHHAKSELVCPSFVGWNQWVRGVFLLQPKCQDRRLPDLTRKKLVKIGLVAKRCQKDLWCWWFLMTLIKVQKPVLTSFRVILKPHPAKIGDLSIAIPEVQNGAEGEVAQPKGSRVTKATLHARICASSHLVVKHGNGHSTV